MSTLTELYAHNDWARDKLMALAHELDDEALDQPFEMGPGSLRATLRHLYGAERIWFERWQGAEQPQFPRSRTIIAMDDLWQAFRKLAAARNESIESLDEQDLTHRVAYTDQDGRNRTNRLGDLMIHVCIHGVHHRAQALNMLRLLDAEVPRLDYVDWLNETHQ